MSIVGRLQLVAAATPGAPALAEGGLVFSYEALLDEAVRHAGALREAGGVRGGRVAIVLPRSADAVVTMWATWMLGASVVPVPTDWPAARRTEVLARARAAVIVGQAGTLDPGARARPITPVEPNSSDEAWLVFTSGSTGAPRGVVVPHRGIGALVDAQVAAFDLGPGARALWMLSPGFDASFSDILTAHLSGACLVVAPPFSEVTKFSTWATVAGVTHADLPPGLLASIFPVRPPALRVVVCGGEPSPPAVVREWASAVRFVNVYGPTEATVCTSLGIVDAADWATPGLGRPIPGVRYRVENEELWIAGDCLADGYLNDEPGTAERFVLEAGQRWFRTGDRVRADASGQLVYVGRLDRMVKLGGRRVELGEVEAAVLGLPGVARCRVRVSGSSLVAEVVPLGRPVDEEAARSALREVVPSWMVPNRVLSVRRLPEGVTGKVVYGAAQPAGSESPVGARSAAAAVWAAVLGRDVGEGEDLDAAGRDSITVVEVLARASAAGLRLDPERVARGRTTAETFERVGAHGEWATVDALRARVPETPAFGRPRGASGVALVTGATGLLGAAVVARLSRSLERVVCLVRAPGPLAARARLLEAVRGLGADEGRLTAICGDLALDGLGLRSGPGGVPVQGSLELHGIDRIVHLGAKVDLVAPYEVVAPSIVDGTARLLQAAARLRVRSFVFVSSLGIFVSRSNPVEDVDEDSDPSQGGQIVGGYTQARWVADALVSRLVRAGNGPAVALLRPGMVVPGPDERWTDRAQLRLFLRGLAAVGALPEQMAVTPALRCDLTPMDLAVEAVVRVTLTGQEGVFHIGHPVGATLADWVAGLERAGHPLRHASDGARAHVVPVDLAEAVATLGLQRFLGEPVLRSGALFLTTGTRFHCTRTSARLGLPEMPTAAALVDRCIRAAGLDDQRGVGR